MIPVATTTIAVLRVPADPMRDPEDPQPPAQVIASAIRAAISTPRGRERIDGAATQEVVEFRLSCDPTDLAQGDQVRDEVTGETYHVTWARDRRGLGMDHVQAGLKQVTGAVSAS